MTTQSSNEFKEQLWQGTVDGRGDVFKIILMESGFAYNPVTHGIYANVSANELPTASGYTAGGATLAGVAISQDDVNNQGKIAWNNVSWVASGGNIVASGAIIYDDTVASPADVIVGYIDFSGDQTTIDGGTFTIANIYCTTS